VAGRRTCVGREILRGRKFWPDVSHHRVNRALGVSHDRKCVVHGRHEPDVSRASPEQGLSCAQNRLGETCTSHVSHDRKFSPDDLRNDEVLRHRGSDVHHDQKCEVHGHRAENCCGVQEALGSSRASPERWLSCAQNQLGETCANHLSSSCRDRRCAERGLPNVMKVRQILLREACVDRGRRLPKRPCGELI